MKATTKTENIKQILENLITTYKTNRFTEQEIKAIIQKTLILVDDRPIDRWFKLVFRLNYIIQPEPLHYSINLGKLSDFELDVRVPRVTSPYQKRLF